MAIFLSFVSRLFVLSPLGGNGRIVCNVDSRDGGVVDAKSVGGVDNAVS